MYLGYVLREFQPEDIAGHSVFGYVKPYAAVRNNPAVKVIHHSPESVVVEAPVIVVYNRNAVLDIVELGVERLKGVSGSVERCHRLERPVPHHRTDVPYGAVVIPEQHSRGPSVAVAEFVVVPDLPDALVVHRPEILRLAGKFLYGLRLSVFVGKVLVQSRHLRKAVSVQIVPDLLVYRPEVLFVHHLPQALDCWQARGTVFGIESVHPASAVRCRVFVMSHRVDLLVRAAVVYAVAFGLHLISSRTVQPINQFAHSADF